MSIILRLGTAVALATVTLSPASAAARGGGLDEAVAAYERAQMAGDRAALSRLLADDYVLINSSGAREDKTAFIADLTDPTFKLAPYAVQAPVRRTWTDGAVIAGVARQSGSQGGNRFDACIRFADVWKRIGRSWQVVLTHVARLPPPDAGGCKAV